MNLSLGYKMILSVIAFMLCLTWLESKYADKMYLETYRVKLLLKNNQLEFSLRKYFFTLYYIKNKESINRMQNWSMPTSKYELFKLLINPVLIYKGLYNKYAIDLDIAAIDKLIDIIMPKMAGDIDRLNEITQLNLENISTKYKISIHTLYVLPI